MISVYHSIAALVLATSPSAQAQKTLSPSAEASKTAFTALMGAKEGVPASRIRALKSPGAAEYFASPQGMMGFFALAQSLEKAPEGADEAVRLYADLLPKIDHLRSWDGYQSIYAARAAKKAGDPALAERVRRESANLIARTISKADFETPKLGDRSVVEFFKLDLAHLNGNAIRGELIDKPAPAMRFRWSSDPGVKSLADLKGKVVVLDFWATWCKPCIGLFPKVREISQAYVGKPVVFVGVTSLQGYSMDPEKGKVDTKGDPKKEFALMPNLMKKLGVTWTVAFSEADCFNPDFDVMSIPHMAVIDPKGVVRFDDVEPDTLRGKIDGLLAAQEQARVQAQGAK